MVLVTLAHQARATQLPLLDAFRRAGLRRSLCIPSLQRCQQQPTLSDSNDTGSPPPSVCKMDSAAAYTVVAASDGVDSFTVASSQELRTLLQKPDDDIKLEALRTIIISTLNGHPHPTLLMPIIQYVLPSRSKMIKKMLHFYWEVCPKLDENGKLKQEMILVCNAIRNDLQHPNEYIRGSTLRFLQKIKEAELLEPLVPSILSCLEHRHSYVRKNALFCIYAIYTSPTTTALIPDATELMETFLAAEADSTCKRNAFVFLAHTAPEKALEYLNGIAEQISSADEGMQLAVIELIRKETKTGAVQSKVSLLSKQKQLQSCSFHRHFVL